MSEASGNPSRPIKLKLKSSSFKVEAKKPPAGGEDPTSITSAPPVDTPTAMSPSVSTPPASTPGAHKKIRLIKLPGSRPSTPADGTAPAMAPPAQAAGAVAPQPAAVTRTKAGRTSRPTAKKRAKEESSDGEGLDGNSQAPKRIKLKSSQGGKMPMHPPGDGYDSEMDGAEEDPVVEEQVVFRMMEGEHLDYLRRMVDERKIGAGAEFQLRWLNDRRGYVRIQGQMFATVLVDLPTIIESMKTWDRKAMVKSADICQMLLAFAKVKNEQEALAVPLPRVIQLPEHRWPHGLTPPMHDSIHRRFRKRLSHKDIQNKEAEVERLLNDDKAASQTKWEWVDDRRTATAAWTPEYQGEEAYSEDAEGEMDDGGYFPAQGAGAHEDGDEVDLEAMMDAAFDEDDMNQEGGAGDGATPAARRGDGGGSPAAASDDDDDDDDDGDIDPDDKERRNQEKGVRDELAELDHAIAQAVAKLNAQGNALLRKRMEEKIKSLREMKRLKAASVGINLDNDD